MRIDPYKYTSVATPSISSSHMSCSPTGVDSSTDEAVYSVFAIASTDSDFSVRTRMTSDGESREQMAWTNSRASSERGGGVCGGFGCD